ncbi:MAG: peptidylprolyl isomerase [Myxococcaceae bacterium]|nr:peptidylprolyl isomerase [Myxococcaceae bacterium]
MKTLVLALTVLLPAAALADGKLMKAASEGKDLYATFTTSEGSFVVKLFSKEAPKTVTNFVGLATGEKEWTDPRDGKKKTGVALYSESICHRIIAGFMIQCGDPTGTGRGDPGYRFEDEFQSGRGFDKPGLLAMANAGPGTNGSQFFVTVSTPKYLNNKHTIFGEVVSGYDQVEKISKVATQPGDKPVKDVVIKKIEISEKGPAAAAPAPAPAKK